MPKTSCVRPSRNRTRGDGVRPATILHLLDTTEYSLHADIHEETTHGAPSPPPRRVPGVPVKNGRTGRHEHARRAHGARGVEVTDAASSCAHPAGDACKTIPSSDSGGGGQGGGGKCLFPSVFVCPEHSHIRTLDEKSNVATCRRVKDKALKCGKRAGIIWLFSFGLLRIGGRSC